MKNNGRLMGAKFKTFEGAAKRARLERSYDGTTHLFLIEAETDSHVRAQGYAWRIRKTKRIKA